MKTFPKERTSDLVIQKTGDETLVYDLKKNRAFCLNATSTEIWSLCDGKRDAAGIAGSLSAEMKKPVTEEVVWLALDQLNREGLLEDDFEADGEFAGLSRRELIRRAGIASAIALPLISSIIAPQATAAQSGGCVVGTCIPAGTSVCSVCSVGQTVNVQGQITSDGSCGGDLGVVIYDINCGLSNFTSGKDLIVIAVS
jgi:hypothetical protein